MQLTADEIDRFWSYVVKGPSETSSWLFAQRWGSETQGRGSTDTVLDADDSPNAPKMTR